MRSILHYYCAQVPTNLLVHSNYSIFLFLPVAHRSRNTWNGGGVGGGGAQVLLKNGFLTNCLLFGSTKVNSYY